MIYKVLSCKKSRQHQQKKKNYKIKALKIICLVKSMINLILNLQKKKKKNLPSLLRKILIFQKRIKIQNKILREKITKLLTVLQTKNSLKSVLMKKIVIIKFKQENQSHKINPYWKQKPNQIKIWRSHLTLKRIPSMNFTMKSNRKFKMLQFLKVYQRKFSTIKLNFLPRMIKNQLLFLCLLCRRRLKRTNLQAFSRSSKI